VAALFSREEDTDVHRLNFRMNETGKLIAYAHLRFPPHVFIRYFNAQETGFILTAHEERIKRVFERVMTPELALKLIDAGIRFERGAEA
jgi:hypothetical protein